MGDRDWVVTEPKIERPEMAEADIYFMSIRKALKSLLQGSDKITFGEANEVSWINKPWIRQD